MPLEISYHGMEKDETIDTIVRSHAAGLEEVCDYIISCRVAVERLNVHQESGNPFRVRILVRIPPQQELVVKRETTQGSLHDNLSKVVVDAFQAMSRQLDEAVEQQHNEVKDHPEQQVQALVFRIFKDKGFGFLKTEDGQEVYFHRNSVLHDDFERLEVGTGVRFAEEQGEKGPQATSVAIVDKPGVRLQEGEEEQVEPPLGWQ